MACRPAGVPAEARRASTQLASAIRTKSAAKCSSSDLTEDAGSRRVQGMGDADQPDGWHLFRISSTRRRIQLHYCQRTMTTGSRACMPFHKPLTRSSPTCPSASKTSESLQNICFEKTLELVKQLADQKPEDSPLALPIKQFPASIPASRTAAHQDRDAGRHHKSRSARLQTIRAIPRSRLHPRRPRPARHLRSCLTARSTISSSSARTQQPI